MIHHCVLLQWPHVFHVQYIKFNNFRFSPALEKKKNREQPLFQFQNCPRCEHFETYNITVLEPLSFSSRSHGPYLCGCNNGKVLLKQQSSCSELTGSPRRPALLPVPRRRCSLTCLQCWGCDDMPLCTGRLLWPVFEAKAWPYAESLDEQSLTWSQRGRPWPRECRAVSLMTCASAHVNLTLGSYFTV